MVTLVYAGCFLALAVLAGLAAASGPHWVLRLPVVAATPVLAVAVWWQLSQRDGLPVGARPPDGSSFVAGLVQAPTPSSSGAIFLWTQSPGASAPRAFRVPYSPSLEKQVARAAAQVRKGARMAVSSRPARASDVARGRPRSGAPQPQVAGLRFYQQRPQAVPRKETEAGHRSSSVSPPS
jgi:hypothetical protein